MSFPGIDYKLPNYAGGNCYTRTTASFAFALQQSCNTPFASIALDLGQKAIADEAEKFGFGQDFGDQLKLDSAPSFFPSEELDDARLAQSSIGQRDVRATPLQINTMTAAIANDGVQMQPNLIKAVRSPDLRPISEPKPQALRTATTSGDRPADQRVDGQRRRRRHRTAVRPCPVSRWPARPVPRNSATA